MTIISRSIAVDDSKVFASACMDVKIFYILKLQLNLMPVVQCKCDLGLRCRNNAKEYYLIIATLYSCPQHVERLWSMSVPCMVSGAFQQRESGIFGLPFKRLQPLNGVEAENDSSDLDGRKDRWACFAGRM